ncbi:hypothetical protein E2C01_097035 [Portunus trituberculatus]|uniref:Uncharacterized protein n=1 Tax=Portunus trituberculatus TaxID=210409 RepID=A0A5B7JZD7_PORTR|nr:hypothetical protein [Portunus trituberculatus]
MFIKRGHRGTVEPCVLWGPRGLQAHGFKSCPRSECRLAFLTRGKDFLAELGALLDIGSSGTPPPDLETQRARSCISEPKFFPLCPVPHLQYRIQNY